MPSDPSFHGTGEVARASDIGDRLRVVLVDGSTLGARTVAIAAGVHDELPPIPGLAERWAGT
ncbi:MAG: hypothetical protein ACK5IN_06835 [Microbacterium sp.]|uniref:hypothetical protein n=1 Tax=Microbacterium sp. TaxID=51671 RepID=UPI003A87DCE6